LRGSYPALVGSPHVFYLAYLASELRRRRGRTFLTALGLGVGVGLVVTVSALSDGLDKAQDEVLRPLTGVGTDLSVARPLDIDADGGGGGPFANLSAKEQEQLRKENGAVRVRLNDLGEPGERFSRTNFVAASQLSFPESEANEVAGLDGVRAVAAGLTLTALQVSGKVPENTGGPPLTTPGAGGPPDDVDFDSSTVTGVDQHRRSLGAITAGQVSEGRYLSADDSREAVLNTSYARRKHIEVGDTISLKGRKFEVVGLASPPLGGQASDIYLKLDQLQRLSGREGRVNTLYVRAAGSDDVAPLSAQIERTFEGAEVTTAQDLADRVGGSLADAKDLAGKLGTALTIVALLAAFLIASLLTLSSVAKRVRELGTLKAVGWPQRLVVRQVTAEALAQGALGGVLGAVLGIGGAALVGALGPELEATVAQTAQRGPGPAAFGQGAIEAGSRIVTLDAPVDASLLLLAVGLALLGGLLAGAVGGARAARLRPADALRHID
jgi:ABC-type antimicrobial peptide transport system permease subunit